jgi:MFS family permease
MSWLLRLPAFRALAHRDYRLLSWGQLFGTLGLWMDEVTRGWLIYELTSSPLQLGLVRGTQAVVFLALVPLAGSAADRYSRRLQLALSQGLTVAGYAFLAGAVLLDRVELWHIYATAVIVAVGQVFQQPARASLLPETVPRELLTNAIGLSAVLFNVARIVGPAVAGVLIVASGTGGAFAAQALFMLFATLNALLMRSGDAPPAASRARETCYARTLEGLRGAMRNDAVRAGVTCSLAAAFLIVPFMTLLPVYARDLLKVGANGQGMLVSTLGAGALASATLLASMGDRLPKGLLMLWAAFLYGFIAMAFAASPWFGLSLAIMFAAGTCQVGCNALVQSIVQAHSPPEFRGRVMALFSLNVVLSTAGGVVVSALAVAVGPRWAVALMGLTGAVTVAVLYLRNPGARHIR